MAPYLQPHLDGVYLAVRLQPRASKNEIGPVHGATLKIKVTAPPVESAANEALLRLLVERLNCPRNAVQLVRGQTSRNKTIFVRGLAPEVLESRLTGISKS